MQRLENLRKECHRQKLDYFRHFQACHYFEYITRNKTDDPILSTFLAAVGCNVSITSVIS